MRISSFDQAEVDVFNLRFGVLTISVIVILAALVLRLWFLQILNGPSYRAQSENNRIHLQKLPPFRGMIFDRNGDLLVDNRPSYGLYIIPEDIQDSKKLIKFLPAELVDGYSRLMLADYEALLKNKEKVLKEIDNLVNELNFLRLKEQIKGLTARIKELEKKKKKKQLEKAERKLTKLTAKLSDLKKA